MSPSTRQKAKKAFQQLADEVLDKQRPALHNQAMMEFGAMLCKPKNPACGICPVHLGCAAFKTNATTYLPVKLKKVKIRKRYFNYLLIMDGEMLLMNKRGESDIWANMYDLPLIETEALIEPAQLFQRSNVKELIGSNIAIKRYFGSNKTRTYPPTFVYSIHHFGRTTRKFTARLVLHYT
jgi:A/G-specific adenine glycosylase